MKLSLITILHQQYYFIKLFQINYNIVPRLQAFLRKPNRDILFATIGSPTLKLS